MKRGTAVKRERPAAEDADACREYPWQFLAICAMRAVGDESSLKLLDQHPPRADEGSVSQYKAGKWQTEPMSADVRREVKRRVAARRG